jgi:hypothetical protein
MADENRTPSTSLDAFLAAFWKDVEAGTVRSLDEYLARFPGDAERIAREYFAHKRGGSADPSADRPEGPSRSTGLRPRPAAEQVASRIPFLRARGRTPAAADLADGAVMRRALICAGIFAAAAVVTASWGAHGVKEAVTNSAMLLAGPLLLVAWHPKHGDIVLDAALGLVIAGVLLWPVYLVVKRASRWAWPFVVIGAAVWVAAGVMAAMRGI